MAFEEPPFGGGGLGPPFGLYDGQRGDDLRLSVLVAVAVHFEPVVGRIRPVGNEAPEVPSVLDPIDDCRGVALLPFGDEGRVRIAREGFEARKGALHVGLVVAV